MQNTCVLGISVGESFAEYSLLKGAKPLAQKRVYLARETIKQSLTSFLAENADTPPQTVFISLKIPKKLLDYRLSGAVAQITTDGFERWLGLNSSSKELTQEDLIFSVPERTLANGTIEIALVESDIEAIAAKLLLMNCKRVCVHFLHAKANPANQNKAAELLTAKGLEVFLPTTDCDASETERWNKNALNATISSVFNDRKAEIFAALPIELHEKNVHFLDAKGGLRTPTEAVPLHGYFSALTALGKIFGAPSKADVLYLGFEEFTLISAMTESQRWNSQYGPVAIQHVATHALGIQPTLGLHLNVFGHLDFTDRQEGWEPGPMCLGRGQKMSLLDLWSENSKLTSVAGLSDRLTAQGVQRFKNSLLVLTKTTAARNTDLSHITKEMQSLTMQRLALETFLHRRADKLKVTGPLASVFANVFKKDSNTSIESHDFHESTATALWGSQVLQGTP